MPITPGRPHSPTLHPRTRPEANEFASRNRSTGDWFRHDGKNVEHAAPPPNRVGMNPKQVTEVAQKNKGVQDEWFQHDPVKHKPDPSPAKRCPTEESKHIRGKIYGKDEGEAWFKHEENKDYVSPRPMNRITEKRGGAVKEKMTKANQMDWYKHDHGPEDHYKAPTPKQRMSSANASKNAQKLKGPAQPDWYSHEPKKHQNGNPGNGDLRESRTLSAEQASAGEYLDRNRCGSAASWYGHDSSVTPECPGSPRVSSKDGEAIAKKLQGESANWFNHDANKNFHEPAKGPRVTTGAGRDMYDRSRGSAMQGVMTQSGPVQASHGAERAIKPEAKETAAKNKQGLMAKYLDQDANRGYQSSRGAPKAVRPEARETFDKSKGVMGDCMQGYPDEASKKEGPRVKPEAQGIAQKNKGRAAQVITGESPLSERGGGRAVKTEAVENARRNEGTLKGMMDNYGHLAQSDRPVARLASSAAHQNAERNKGSMSDVLYGGN